MSTLKGRVKDPETGKIKSGYEEPRGNAIALRLPLSLDEEVRRLAAEQGLSPGEWIRAAIAAHLKERGENASPPKNAGTDSDE